MAPRETENNAYVKFWGDKQRALWYVVVFSGVDNKNVRQTWLYTVITNNNNRSKKYTGISTSDLFTVTASSPRLLW